MGDTIRFLTKEELGPAQSLTPEGFLLCKNIRLARIGVMVYGPNDGLPIDPGPDGLIHVHRDPEEVFAPAALASFEGKPVTDDHPAEMVTPASWRGLSRGHGQNIRRGEGNDQDFMVGDLLIMDSELIDAVRSKKKTEVSCGYDAEYDETAPGVGRQWKITGNHIAIVEQGRCGGSCAVGDQANPKQELNMAKNTKDKNGWIARLLRGIQTKDEKGVAEALEEGKKAVADEAFPAGEDDDGDGGDHTHVHVHLNGKGEKEEVKEGDAATKDDDEPDSKIGMRLDALEAGHKEILAAIAALGKGGDDGTGDSMHKDDDLAAEAPTGMMDKAIKATDSQYLVDAFHQTVSDAEILAPGTTLPTLDRKAAPKVTLDAICKLRRSALDAAYAVEKTKAIITKLTGDKPLDTKAMTCDALRSTFRAAASMTRDANTAALNVQKKVEIVDQSTKANGARSIADINKINRERYAKAS